MPHAFDVFRIGIALVLLAKIAAEMPDFFALYGRYGVVQWSISSIRSSWYPKMSWIADPAEQFGIPSEITISILAAVYIASLLLLLVGFASRFSSLLAWLCHAMMLGNTGDASYGVDMFATLGLFYCCIAPTGFLSLDCVLFAREVRSTYWSTALLRLLQLQLFFVYAVAFFGKAAHIHWWSGEAIWLSVMHPIVSHEFNATWLAYHPGIAKVLSWSTLMLEGFYPLAMLSRVRIVWVFLIVFMHIGMGILLGLWIFSSMMIILNLSAFASREIFVFSRFPASGIAPLK